MIGSELLTNSLRQELDFFEPIDPKDLWFEKIEDARKAMPQMVAVSVLEPVKVGGQEGFAEVVLDKGVEYILPVPFYLAILASNKDAAKVVVPSKKTFKQRFNRYSGQSLDGKSLLVWRYGGLGDLMFVQPMLQYLRKKYPTCKICFATAPPNVELLKAWPVGIINKFAAEPFRGDLMDRYDYHLTFEGSIERCREAEKVNAYDVFRLVAGLDFDPAEWPPILEAQEFIKARYRPYIPNNTVVLQLKSTSPIRTYPLNKTKDLVEALNSLGYVAGIIERRPYAFSLQDYLVENSLGPEKAVNLALFSASVLHCINIVDCCAGAIAVDSAVVHIAAALSKPVLGMYGAFPGDLRMRYYKTGEWIDAGDWNECGLLPCCFHQHDVSNCPYLAQGRAAGCLDVLKPSDIAERFDALYKKLK